MHNTQLYTLCVGTSMCVFVCVREKEYMFYLHKNTEELSLYISVQVDLHVCWLFLPVFSQFLAGRKKCEIHVNEKLLFSYVLHQHNYKGKLIIM